MNQEKIGAFLKALRKEKDLTQEQIAEQFNVSDRTVSRWETGRNMPDLSILVELADFYDVDIREIIDGERKSENMNEEMKESLLKAAEYADNEKSNLAKRMRYISIAGLAGFALSSILESLGLTGRLPVFAFLTGLGTGIAIGALITMVLYTTGILAKIAEVKADNAKSIFIAFAIIAVILFVCSILASL